jgi:hypothetical protein
LAGQAMANENGILYKPVSSEDANYCHIKYAAYSEQSLRTGNLEFNASDVIDMYGPCNFDPSSPEEVRKQLSQLTRGQFGSTDYNGDGGSA